MGPQVPAREVLRLARSRPPALGSGRLVCIDGPAGSGKTTIAAHVAALVDPQHLRVVHMDDLYDGWDGLPRLPEQLDRLLLPLAAGESGSYRRYDWRLMAYDGVVTVPPTPMLVLEGVGSGAAAYDRLRSVLVWVEAPYEERLGRGLDRDGAAFAPHWDGWARAERELFARERTRSRADLVVSTATGVPDDGGHG